MVPRGPRMPDPLLDIREPGAQTLRNARPGAGEGRGGWAARSAARPTRGYGRATLWCFQRLRPCEPPERVWWVSRVSTSQA